MKHLLFAVCIYLLPAASFSQLNNVLKRVKNTASNTAETRADNEASSVVNNSIDKLFKKKEKKAEQTDATNNDATAQNNQPPANALKAYAKFDFVQGEKVVYAEDFMQDAVGEFPLQWTTKTKGSVMKLNQYEGQWLTGSKNSEFISVNKNELGDDYTIEFDMIYFFADKEPMYVMPDLRVRVLNNFVVDYTNRSGNVSEREGEQSYELNIHPKGEIALAWIDTYNMPGHFISDKTEITNFNSSYNQIVHYSMQVQKSRLRVWMNEKKVFDLPQAINADKKMARIAFGFGSTSYDEDKVGFYVSNIRIATGIPDSRHKLLETGKFSTSGILFNVNSDEIKPESSGIIREIGKVLTENPSVKIKITGHTSSDGNATRNMELSKQRATSVKNFLIKECGISADRIDTEGLGDTKPVAPNNTQDGRVQNRRVEFTKL